MARADRRSARRAKQTPGIRASGGASAVEQTLFFSRIRRQAKWVFVLLALAFGIGFVAFGVGSDVQGGIADLLQGRAPSTGPSVGDAQERVDANPRDPAALRELATALQNDGRPDEAVPILERYVEVRPQEDAALSELASLYLARGGRLRQEAQLAQYRAQLANPGASILPPPTTPLGQALGSGGAISDALAGRAQTELTEKIARMQTAYRDALETYQRIAALRPDDATVQLEMGDAAMNAGDNTVALASFKRFLELAPDDPQAPLVEQQVKQLEASLAPASSG
jgi:tetratricopeptide (TPR) repeat protein